MAPWQPWDWHVDNEVTALFLMYKQKLKGISAFP